MAQIFHPGLNAFARGSLIGSFILLFALLGLLRALARSPYFTRAEVLRPQPIPFSHKHHVGGLGLDCRYCHTAVEEGPFAGLPPTQTCMNCHSQIWADSPVLEPVRASYRTGRPIAWTRVHDLPDFVFFDHSIHVRQGIGCATCHGDVAQMPLVRQEKTLLMEWCLECHRAPERHVRPREEAFRPGDPPDPDLHAGTRLAREYGVEPATRCSDCHR